MRRCRGLPHLVSVVIACSAFVAQALAPASSEAYVYPLNYRDRAIGRVYQSGANWNGAKAQIEVRSGLIGESDANSGAFVLEAIWVGDLNASSYVELGYSRGWEGLDINTPYWACYTLGGNYYQHRVVNCFLTLGDYSYFKITKVSGTDNLWRCWIEGVPAEDEYGDSTANSSVGNNFDSIDAGLECSCSTGELGTSTDPVTIRYLKKTSDGGGTWSYGPGYAFVIHDLEDCIDGWWVTPGQKLENYRNF